MSKNIVLATVTFAKDNVLCKVHSQSPLSNEKLGIPSQTYIDPMSGEEKQGYQTLRLAEANFKEKPFKGEFIAIEIDPSAVRKAEGGKMMQASNFKLLAIGDEAKEIAGKALTSATPATPPPFE